MDMKLIKKLAVALTVIAFILTAAALSASAAENYPSAYINTSEVNIRSGAGTSHSIIANVGKGTKVTLLNGRRFNTDWYHIKLNSGQKGYVHHDYLTINKNQLYIPSKSSGYAGYTVTYTNFVNTTGSAPKWTSSNTKLATVKNGVVSCHKEGSVTITVKAGSKSASTALTIKKAEVTVSATSLELYTDDDPVALTFHCAKPVTLTSSDTNVVTVSSGGKITPVAAGSAKITVKSNSDSATCSVTVKKRVINLSVTKTTLYADCYAVITPSGGKYAYSYKSSDTGVLTVDKNGWVKGVSAGKAKVTVTSGSLTKTKTFTVKANSGLSITKDSATIYAGVTLYLKASGSVTWKSSDTSIAKVDEGFVHGVKKGKVIITASNSSGARDCVITVKSAEPVRFVYTSQNFVLLGKKVKLYAITDTKRQAVKFKLTDKSGNVTWVKNATKKAKDSRYFWTAETTMTKAGAYTIEAYSRSGSGAKFCTSNGGKSTFFVSSTSDRLTTTYGERRATTALIRDIATFEGFLPKVTPDELVADTPTVGYGRVVFEGTTFYNSMTQDEAFAYLVKTVNDSGFTARTNKLLHDNNIKYNQPQFDALVCFAYNLGAYALESDDEIIGILNNTYGKASNKLKGYINGEGVALREKPDTGSTNLKSLSAYTTVTLVSTKVYNNSWFNVMVGNKEGYVKKGYVTRRTTSTSIRDLRNINYSKFRDWMLARHHASGSCYWGLLYRRIDEVEMFMFNDYEIDGSENKYNMRYYCPKSPGFGIG